MNIKQKTKNKNTTIKCRYFPKSKFVGVNRFLLVYLNRNSDVKRLKTRRYYLPKCIIKNYNGFHQWKKLL